MKKWVPISLFLLLGSSVYADTTVSGTISTDTTWSPAGGVYIISSDFSVASGTTLTIEPGTIIKAKTTALGGPSIYGRLMANGTSELPIYFTSFYDDSVGGDTGNDGPTVGTIKDWQGLYFRNGSIGSLDHVIVRFAGYGGFGFGDHIGMENDGGTVTIRNSLIDQNNQHGLWQKSGTLTLENTVISNHLFGLTMWGGTVTATANSFLSNSQYGLHAPTGDSLSLIDNNFTNNGKTAYIAAPINFSHTGNTSTDVANRGFETGGETRNGAVWHTSDLPFIINGLTVGSGKTLTLSAGTVLKMQPGGLIDVRGSLVSSGTASAPVYLTSLKDDSVLGDTNGDGALSSPNMTNWNGIAFQESSVGNLSHSIIKYSGGFTGLGQGSGRAGVFNLGGALTMNNVSFSNNFQSDLYQNSGSLTATKTDFDSQQFGLIFDGGTGLISQSKFQVLSNAIDNRSGVIIDARHNWWGSVAGPRTPDNPVGTGGAISGLVLYFPWLNSDPLTISTPVIDPVIIIPGIMGSAYKNGELVIDPILHTYDDLIATLVANGYVEGENLFSFPYEWRDSNELTAHRLNIKIAVVKAICDCNKVDLVAHSMGGLVARSYIQSVDYDNDVDQLIFLGTPHKGAPKSYLQWEAGKFPPDFDSNFTQPFFQAEALRNGYSTIFNYIHNRPILSVQELLPVFDYIKDDDTGVVRQYPNNYPTNLFLENLNNDVSSLLSAGVEITNIVGNSGADKTIERIRVIPTSHGVFWEHGEPEGFGALIGDSGLEKGVGDNTVSFAGSVLDGITNEEITATHNKIPTVAENRIYKILTGNDSITNIDTNPNADIKILLLQLLSPIDFVITAPNGKKIGKNFSNGTEYDEILGAFYSGFQTDNEYITILNPLDGKYKVEVQGTGNGGDYGILTSYVSDDISVTKETSGLTGPNQITTIDVLVNNTNPETIAPERIITSEVLLNDIIKAYELGWITDKKLKDKLVKKAEAIIKIEKKIEIIVERLPNGKKKQKKIEKLETKIDKKAAKALLIELKGYSKGKINQQAYDIIKADLEWLINN